MKVQHLGIVFLLLVAGAFVASPLLLLSKPIGPEFPVGTCLVANYEVESWEPRPIYKILEVGKGHYRTRMWHDGVWGTMDFSESFESRFRKVTSCPDEGKP